MQFSLQHSLTNRLSVISWMVRTYYQKHSFCLQTEEVLPGLLSWHLLYVALLLFLLPCLTWRWQVCHVPQWLWCINSVVTVCIPSIVIKEDARRYIFCNTWINSHLTVCCMWLIRSNYKEPSSEEISLTTTTHWSFAGCCRWSCVCEAQSLPFA